MSKKPLTREDKIKENQKLELQKQKKKLTFILVGTLIIGLAIFLSLKIAIDNPLNAIPIEYKEESGRWLEAEKIFNQAKESFEKGEEVDLEKVEKYNKDNIKGLTGIDKLEQEVYNYIDYNNTMINRQDSNIDKFNTLETLKDAFNLEISDVYFIE